MAVNSAHGPRFETTHQGTELPRQDCELRAKKKEIKRGGGHLRLEKTARFGQTRSTRTVGRVG